MYPILRADISKSFELMNSQVIKEKAAMFGKLSDQGRQWCVSALDPFHDYQQTLRGYPDLTSERSVVQMYSQALTISAPAASTYSARIVFTGLEGYAGSYIKNGTIGGLQYSTLVGSSKTMEPVMIFTADGVNVPNMQNYYTGVAGVAKVGLGTYVDETHSKQRLIGIAIEVHNTTADIYKQGTVTVAQIPAKESWHNVIMNNTDPGANPAFYTDHCRMIGPFPDTVGETRVIPDSGEWEAKSGVYLIPRMNRQLDCSTHHEWVTTSYYEEQAGAASNNCYYTCPNNIGRYYDNTLNKGFALGYNWSAFTPAVIHFSGLSNQTTLQVTLRTIVEVFPVCGDTLLPLSQPSPPYDPVALQVYQYACSQLPYAVKVDMNAGGKYFKMVLDVLARVAPDFATALTVVNPTAGAVAMAVSKILNIANNAAQSRSKPNGKKPITIRRVNRSVAGNPAVPFKTS